MIFQQLWVDWGYSLDLEAHFTFQQDVSTYDRFLGKAPSSQPGDDLDPFKDFRKTQVSSM